MEHLVPMALIVFLTICSFFLNVFGSVHFSKHLQALRLNETTHENAEACKNVFVAHADKLKKCNDLQVGAWFTFPIPVVNVIIAILFFSSANTLS